MKQLTHRRLASIAGYLILGVFTYIVFAGGFVVSLGHSPIVIAIIGVWLIGLTYESVREWKSAYSADSEEQRFDFPKDTLSFLSLFLGTLITFWISVDLGHGAVVASGLVGIFAAAFLKPYAAPIFSGSFVGMASSQVFGYPGMALAGVIAGGVFVLSKHVFNGFGGKLGTIAWSGCVFAALIMGKPLLTGEVPGWDVGWLLLVYCIAGAAVTFILSVWFGQGAVMASGMVGLAAGLLLPALHGPALGGTLAVGVYSASFAGMSGTNRFEKAYWLAIGGVMVTLAFMYSAPFMGGGGGKLGTIAFGSMIGVRGLMEIGMHLQRLLGKTEQESEVAANN
ncbi:MAG: hypothetical protein EA384_12725 [Spirochaetaceae bacterium]|nr:MAG: hypothetical protein EA384_12725 [Spirochaetaceae bacterium]